MEVLKNAIVSIVGDQGEVSMPSNSCIFIKHSQGKHWFRIYTDAKPGSDRVFLLSDQGGIQAVSRSKLDVAEFLSKMFGR